MNKAAGIGAVIAVIIGIIIVSATFSMDSSVEDKSSVSEEVVIGESIEEPEVVEEEGKDITVELRETIGLKGS